jgi:hypothetical protein
MHTIFNFSYFEPDYPTSWLTATSLAPMTCRRLCCWNALLAKTTTDPHLDYLKLACASATRADRHRSQKSRVCKDRKWFALRIRGRGLISLWLYKENNKLRDWKKCIYYTYSPLSSTHLWLRCSNLFNPSKKNSLGCGANRKSQRLISTSM